MSVADEVREFADVVNAQLCAADLAAGLDAVDRILNREETDAVDERRILKRSLALRVRAALQAARTGDLVQTVDARYVQWEQTEAKFPDSDVVETPLTSQPDALRKPVPKQQCQEYAVEFSKAKVPVAGRGAVIFDGLSGAGYVGARAEVSSVR